jgi:hypothetical protein
MHGIPARQKQYYFNMPKYRFYRETRGAVAAVTAIFIIVAVGVLALVIDLGHLFMVKSELQRAADAGAIAAAKDLLPIPPGTTSPVSITPSCTGALASAQAIVTANQADGAPLQLLSSDVIFGSWDGANFLATGCAQPQQVNAVKVVVRKDHDANGAVTLFFARALPGGLSSQELTAQALGLTGFAGYAPPGAFTFPLAIDSNKVSSEHIGDLITIHLNPTVGDGGCWHSFDDKSPGTSDLKDLVDGTTPSPAVKVGDLIKVKEGVSDAVLQELGKVLADKGGTMDVLLPVVAPDSHADWTEVLGFAAFHITQVENSGSDKYVQGYAVPDYVAPGVAPGGPNFGLWAGVPKMVQ